MIGRIITRKKERSITIGIYESIEARELKEKGKEEMEVELILKEKDM